MSFDGSLLEISRSEDAKDYEWRIPASETERLDRGHMLWSPPLSFAGWKLELMCGRKDPSSILSPLFIHLFRASGPSSPSRLLRYWLGAVKGDGGREEEEIVRGRMDPGDCVSPFHPWPPLPELRRTMEQLSSGTLSIVVRLRSGPETDNEMRSLQTEQSTQTDFEDISFLRELSRKYLLHASDHDVLFRVKDVEFRAHKSVLRSRSSVFEAMFRHGMRENVEDTVTIEDLDPDYFGEFLEYAYTGEVGNLSAANALGLYYAGHKYNIPALERKCIDVLKASLSTSLVCDVISLARTHGEEELFESAMSYVTAHLEELRETPQWRQFALSNPLQAKEISSKTGKRRRTSDIQE